MTDFHTIIIGAGPAGLACGTALAKAGKKVLILERDREIGPKVCAGGVTCSGIGKRLPQDLIERSFPEQKIFTAWQKSLISAAAPMVSTVNRKILGQWMANQARMAGAEIRSSIAVRKFTGNRLQTSRGELEFNYLVGADGSISTVRRQLGIATEEVGTGINYFVPGDFPAMEWHLDDGLFANGYSWVFPHRRTASVGAYCDRKRMPPVQLQKNLHLWAAKRGINLDRCKATAALINWDYRGWRFGNIFLAGDAAGLASPLTGEGIYPAIVSGEEIARTILEPGFESEAMASLIARHRLHRKVVEMTGRNRPVRRMITESLVFCLRTGIVPFTALEMAG